VRRDTQRSAGRSYRQYCGVARGLDLVGERWTLLIVRDLLTGPKRYKDLLAGLPGIGTNLLAARLRELEEQHIVVRRVLPPPAGSAVYELTEVGNAIEPVVTALGRWGHRFLGTRSEGEFLSANAYVLAMRAAFRSDAVANVTETYELRIGDQVFYIRVADGHCSTSEGQSDAPDAILKMDVSTLSSLLHGQLSPKDALTTGRIEVTGDAAYVERFVKLFALPSPEQFRLASAIPEEERATRGMRSRLRV